jgi:hydrogenase-4 component B
MILLLLVAAAAVCGASGIPALILGRTSDRGQLAAAILAVAGSALGLAGVALFLIDGGAAAVSVPWSIPDASLSIALDGLGSLFLVPVFLVSGLGAIYGLGYWRQSENPANGRKLRVFYGLLTGGMVLLVLARSSVLFLVGWEVMALAAYFLVATDDRQASVRQAAWVYLVATHLGTMGLLALFALLRGASGSVEWAPIAAGSLGEGKASAIFLLTLFSFGLKAGIMPFHVWLPAAHASAPSHVSGLLSGVMIKMGIYGILRITGYLPQPPLWWGALLVVLGAISGLIGVAAAIGQRDLKRMLAYSSIENVGIITLGMGLALLGRATGAREWVALGLGGALLHILNHGLFKPLLFLCAGSVIHRTHTRELDALGGLAKSMPVTFLGFVVGAGAICGLPALNGFMSELLVYLGLFKAALSDSLAPRLLGALAVAGLAMMGALAVACFVRALGAVFLGTGRSDRTTHAVESPASMKIAILLLALGCLALGLAPLSVAPLLDGAIRSWGEQGGAPMKLSELAPLGVAGLLALGVVVLAGLCGLFLHLRSATGKAPAMAMPVASASPGTAPLGTWDCGYADPSSPRLQYTASSMGEMLAGLFRWAVRLKESRPPPLSTFPANERYESQVTEPLLDGCLHPFFAKWAERFSRLRILQRGNVQIYLVYILVTLVLVIAWAMLSPESTP